MSDVGGADIQADLQDYLNAKDINTLFIKIVENLLIEKPDNPIQFIVKYLQREYPDQTGASPEGAGGGERCPCMRSWPHAHSCANFCRCERR